MASPTRTLDNHFAIAASSGGDPAEAARKAHAELERRWFVYGDRSTLKELRRTEEALGMR